MLTPGNKKLGGHLIWGFGLPSGTAKLCPGMTPTCRRVCYAVRLQSYRPQAAKRYRQNLRLAKRKDFVRRIRAFLIAQGIRVVRIHTGGEFVTGKYIRKWQRIIERSPKVRFFTYTRAWRVPEFREALEGLSQLPNLVLWYSADRDTGMPENPPPNVRIAWLVTDADERPPPEADLVFRTQPLRKIPALELAGVPICPAENGSNGQQPPATCDRCRICWRPTEPRPQPRRISLPVLSPYNGDFDAVRRTRHLLRHTESAP